MGRSSESPRPSALRASPRFAILHPARRLRRLARLIEGPAYLAALASAAALRALSLPASGVDIPQFAGFAETMLASGPCFYLSASTPLGEPWPYPWLYPYGPLWAVMLALLALVVEGRPSIEAVGGVFRVVAPEDWVAAVKALLTLGDVAVALLIYAAAGGGRRGRAAAVVYLASPASLYVTGIYGMFDQLAVAPLLAGLLLASRGRPLAAGVLAGASVAIKPTLAPAALAVAVSRHGGARYLASLAASASLALAPFLAFCEDAVRGALYALVWRGETRLPEPEVYNFNWLASLAVWLDEQGITDGLDVVRLWPVVAVLLLPAAIAGSLGRDAYTAALTGYTWFLASFWGVNYQFLLPLLALTLAWLAHAPRGSKCRAAGAALTVLVSLWPLLFPSEFWFTVVVDEAGSPGYRLVSAITLDLIYGAPESTLYSLALGALEAWLLACTALRGRRGSGG